VRLNAIEKALMNNPVRAGLQRLYEAPLLRRDRAVTRFFGDFVIGVATRRGP
jgi:hypothetical protein